MSIKKHPEGCWVRLEVGTVAVGWFVQVEDRGGSRGHEGHNGPEDLPSLGGVLQQDGNSHDEGQGIEQRGQAAHIGPSEGEETDDSGDHRKSQYQELEQHGISSPCVGHLADFIG